MGAVSVIDNPQDEDLKALYQRLDVASGGLGVINIFKVMAHNPGLLEGWLRFAMNLLGPDLELSPRLREIAILRVFQKTAGEYGFAHHVRIARDVGLTDDEIAALSAFETSDLFSDVDRDVIRYVDAVTDLDADASALAKATRKSLSDRELMELTMCIGHWNMLARFLQPLEVPVDDSLTVGLPAEWRDWM
ncbi:MAG: carboxymuconolactone decarboxylase family protein [Chloroflexi bacterium]|nr:carboxymuconolactone decarboxylase family protein [Chloroflexota bacterium]